MAGLVVSGFGLASVFAAPLSNALIAAHGVPTTMLSLGLGLLGVVVGLAQGLQPPPQDYVPTGGAAAVPGAAAEKGDFTLGEMLRTLPFDRMWFLYVCGAGAGLMIISKLAKMVDVQAGLKLGFGLVAGLTAGNGAGRIIAGTLSDKGGRKAALIICFGLQVLCILLLAGARRENFPGHTPSTGLLSALIGANYGANLALFPRDHQGFLRVEEFRRE